MPSTELTKPAEIQAALLDGVELDTVPADAVTRDMVERILGAESLEEAAQDFTATPMEQVEGAELTVTGIAWMRSGYTDGSPVYALIRAKIAESEREEVISCGGRTVMAFLFWAQNNKAMPFKAVFVRKQSNANPEYKFWTVKLA